MMVKGTRASNTFESGSRRSNEAGNRITTKNTKNTKGR